MRRSSLLLATGMTLLLSSAAFAQTAPGATTTIKASVGFGMICNTLDQAEQFVSLRAQGKESKQAMEAVNAQAKNEHACGLAAIAFTREETFDSKSVEGKLLEVVRINIVAGFNGTDWKQTSGMIQYAVMEAEGNSI